MVSVGVARDPDIATPLSTFWYLRSEIRNTTSTEQKTTIHHQKIVLNDFLKS